MSLQAWNFGKPTFECLYGYIFRINGQNHHKIGSLMPTPRQTAKFAQLYIYDTKNEVSNRMKSI